MLPWEAIGAQTSACLVLRSKVIRRDAGLIEAGISLHTQPTVRAVGGLKSLIAHRLLSILHYISDIQFTKGVLPSMFISLNIGTKSLQVIRAAL